MADTRRPPTAALRPHDRIAPALPSSPSYAEGEIIPKYRGTLEAPASPTPAPPPALAYPGDAQNVAGTFQSSQRPPVLSSANMPPPDSEVPMNPALGAAMHNQMNLAPSTDIKKGGAVGLKRGGAVKKPAWRRW